jgi:hypothetical protein
MPREETKAEDVDAILRLLATAPEE